MSLQAMNTRLCRISSTIRHYAYSETYSKTTVPLIIAIMALAFFYGMFGHEDSGDKLLNGFALSLGSVVIVLFIVYALSFEILLISITLFFWPLATLFDGLPALQDTLYAIGSIALFIVACKIPQHMANASK